MAQHILLPQLGIADESAVVSSFRVKKGDVVAVGTPLFAIETGKSVFEVASEYEGTVLALLCGEGDELPIKAPVMVIGQPGEVFNTGTEVDLSQVQVVDTNTEGGKKRVTAGSTLPTLIESTTQNNGNVLASPRARALAEKAGSDVSFAEATGPEGLIIERDVRKLLDEGGAISRTAPEVVAAGHTTAVPESKLTQTTVVPIAPATDSYTDIPMTQMRKVIAKNMSASLTNSAQLTHSSSFDASEILAYRARCKADTTMSGVTLGDMVLFAVSRTLLQFPDMNAHVVGETARRFSRVQLAVAIDIPGGLVVPVIKDAHRKSLLDISDDCKLLAKQARDGTLPPELLSGGTFTVSNLGSLGVEHFTPILNPPQVGILGVNCAMLRPRRKADGSIEFYDAIGLSLTYDHRAVDGAPASRFLKALCDNLAAFTLLLGRW
ncbi:dihydrolipoamide acetyltransferase component of pyruvate dehydrogenase complex [Clostridia bacterium]|nr:dihydrolipoamide acetyltransferase component of pyruvate dehydrogenase complex [Clostridia bacterium]